MLRATILAIVLMALLCAYAQGQRTRRSGGMFGDFPNADPKVGAAAPAFELDTLDGNRFSLEAVAGKRIVVIEFGSHT